MPVVFSSLIFLFFYLTVVTAVYFLLPRKARNLWLFVASVFFYGYGEPVYLLLLFASVTLNYAAGLLLARFSGAQNKKKAVLIGCVALNLLLLGFFKYTDLLIGTVNAVTGSRMKLLRLALPIGISFYTFQSMSYVIDVYRGNCAAQRNYITFGTYVALFPQLIAGPIVRYVDVEEQLRSRRENAELFTHGVKLFLVGLAKKVLLANPMGALWSALKLTPQANGVLGCWVGVAAFTLQIYFDFSGYSDMARGLGNLFGFSFVKNFDYPYLCTSVTEFWRRWHISLGTWFREYVYIPLGGNRKGVARQCVNLLIVWALTGLWHGASWNFALWGLYFGVLLIAEKHLFRRGLQKAPKFLCHVYAMLCVMLGWVIFDFTDMDAMGAFFAGMFTITNGALGAQAAYLLRAYAPLLLIAVFACLPYGKRLYLRAAQTKCGWVADLVGTVMILTLCTAYLVSSTYNPFLYFRF